MNENDGVPVYPFLNLIARFGIYFVAIVVILVAAAGVVVAFVLGMWVIAPFALVGAAVLGILLAGYVEMVRVVVDTLVPR